MLKAEGLWKADKNFKCYLETAELLVAALAPDDSVVAVPMLSCENALWLDSKLDIDPLKAKMIERQLKQRLKWTRNNEAITE